FRIIELLRGVRIVELDAVLSERIAGRLLENPKDQDAVIVPPIITFAQGQRLFVDRDHGRRSRHVDIDLAYFVSARLHEGTVAGADRATPKDDGSPDASEYLHGHFLLPESLERDLSPSGAGSDAANPPNSPCGPDDTASVAHVVYKSSASSAKAMTDDVSRGISSCPREPDSQGPATVSDGAIPPSIRASARAPAVARPRRQHWD